MNGLDAQTILQISAAEMLTLESFKPRPTRWVWKPYVAAGAVTLLRGEPGTGKTYVALAMAAAVTTGGALYGADPCTQGSVVYLSANHDPCCLLRPRFDLLKGDPRRFHLPRFSAQKTPLPLSDVKFVAAMLERYVPRLLVVDPVEAFLPLGHPATPGVIRRISRLAEMHSCAVLLVQSLDASAKRSRSGVPGVRAVAGSELLTGYSPYGETRWALAHVSSRVGPLGPSLAYQIAEDGSFSWHGVSDASAAVISATVPEQISALQEAADFLHSELLEGSMIANEVQARAKGLGINLSALQRAKARLKVLSKKKGAAWHWCLPESDPG
jgi:hypothetical protein